MWRWVVWLKHIIMNEDSGGTVVQKNYAKVSLTDDKIIVCTMHGFMDEKIVRGSLKETRAFVQQLQLQKRPAYLLIDATGVTGQSSGARSLAKTLSGMGLKKIAVYNRNPALGMIIQYIIRAGGMSAYAKIFRSRTAAASWLLGEQQVMRRKGASLRYVLAALVVLLAGSALIGWGSGNDFLKGIVSSLKPMNPVVGVLLLLQAGVVIAMRTFARTPRLRGRLVGGVALLTMAFGWGVLVQTAFGVNLHIDDWLFHGVIDDGTFTGRASPRAALLLMLVAVMELAILTGQQKRWQQHAFHTASVVVLIFSLLSVFGYGFGLVASLLPMSLNTAFCLLLLNHALQMDARQLPFFERVWRAFSKYSQPIIIGMTIVLLTGVAWHQSSRNQERSHATAAHEELARKKENIQDRVSAYVDILRGYRAFFEASEFVSAKEYQAFFASSDITERFPGVSAINFARSVPAAERRSFEESIQQQADAGFPGYRTYRIFPASSQPVSYPVTYLEPHTPTSNFGFDLATNDTRREALEKARDTNDVAATGTIDLNAARADSSLPKRPGFFITIPVYHGENRATGVPETAEGRRKAIYGFVNTVFEGSKLFNDVFKGMHQKDVRYVIQNARTGEKLYEYNPQGAGTQDVEPYVSDVLVAGQVWRLSLHIAPGYGLAGVERFLPSIILGSGLMMAALASALAVGQVRRREQALALAASMTEDLNNERNAAIVVQQKDEAILSSIGDAVFAIDLEGRIILFNRAATDITGSSEQDALGQSYKKLFRFVREKDGKPVDDFIVSALSGKQAKMAEGTLLKREDGSTVPVADSAAPIINTEGEVEGAVVVFRDVTREKELERLKNEFVSVASHELRTPMGAIRAFVSMILAGDYGPVNKNLVEPLHDIHSSTLRLVELVNDLLNVARIEAGRMKFTLADTAVGPALQRVAAELGPLAKQKGIALTAEGVDAPLVQCDESKVAQVVTNLVGNSLKFTDSGSIHITTNVQEDKVEVQVTDTGAGIGEDDRQKVFGKFQQVSSVQEGRPAGTGLGLYISREIIRRMGGDLWIKQSEVGRGTTFAFTLPRTGTALAKRVKMERAKEDKLHPDAV